MPAQEGALKILVVHNRYQQAGGEDKVVEAERAMLLRRGHAVELLSFDNEAISGLVGTVAAAASAFYSVPSGKRISTALQKFRPEVLHVHNFMPTISPAVFFAAEKARVSVVQTLHNYRLLCANAQLFRDGHVCELCVQQRSMLPGVRLGCYRGSRLGSAVVGGSIALQAALGTWDDRVARFIALSAFAADKLGEYRVPRERIRVKPNFVPDAGTGSFSGEYALFVGRLSEEKGLRTLLAADRLGRLPLQVRIAGDGPMRAEVEAACATDESRLIFCGPKSSEEVRNLMRDAVALLVPSLWYEGFPMVMVEALSLGLPVIASRIGGLPEIVEEGVSGLLHEPGNAVGLVEAMSVLVAQSTTDSTMMRSAARARYLERYSEDANYECLMEIYREAVHAT